MRYVVRPSGSTHTIKHARFWVVVDTARQDVIVFKTSDRVRAEAFARQMELIS